MPLSNELMVPPENEEVIDVSNLEKCQVNRNNLNMLNNVQSFTTETSIINTTTISQETLENGEEQSRARRKYNRKKKDDSIINNSLNNIISNVDILEAVDEESLVIDSKQISIDIPGFSPFSINEGGKCYYVRPQTNIYDDDDGDEDDNKHSSKNKDIPEEVVDKIAKQIAINIAQKISEDLGLGLEDGLNSQEEYTEEMTEEIDDAIIEALEPDKRWYLAYHLLLEKGLLVSTPENRWTFARFLENISDSQHSHELITNGVRITQEINMIFNTHLSDGTPKGENVAFRDIIEKRLQKHMENRRQLFMKAQ